MSTTCVSLTPGSAAYFAACRLPKRPAPTTAARISLMSEYRDACGLRHREGARAFKQQALAGLDADHRGANLHHQFDSCGTDRGPIEAQVLSGLRHLRDDQSL